jgi:hypothetical protein
MRFVRTVFNDRAKTMLDESPELESFEKDAERIREYLETSVEPSWHGLAIFASAGTELFEAIPFETPIGDQRLFVDSVPHLDPLAKLIDTLPRYAAVLLDTNKTRILVFSRAAVERDETVVNDQEVADSLERIVSEDGVEEILIAGDEAAVPRLREALPAHLAGMIVDAIKPNHTL